MGYHIFRQFGYPYFPLPDMYHQRMGPWAQFVMLIYSTLKVNMIDCSGGMRNTAIRNELAIVINVLKSERNLQWKWLTPETVYLTLRNR